jgi:outer membrane protein insertion porin family
VGARLILLLLSMFTGQEALAGELPWYVGQTVAYVSLEGPKGGLPAENLEPLLRTKQGEPLDLGHIREDLSLLVQAGGFASADAVVTPWVRSDDEGDPQDAVHVNYRVLPSPRIDRLDLVGVSGPARKRVEKAIDLERGASYYAEPEAVRAEDRVRAELVAGGWPDAKVRVLTVDEGEGRLRVRVQVDLGEPLRIGDVRLGGDSVIAERKVRRWLRKTGLAKRKRIDSSAQADARDRLLQELQDRGWGDARVNMVRVEDGPKVQLNVLTAAGPRLRLARVGRGLPNLRTLREVLGLRHSDRPSERVLEDAGARVESWMADRGFRDASVHLSLAPTKGGHRLTVRSDRGPRHGVQRIQVEGVSNFSRRLIRSALRDADPEGIGDGRVTDDSAGLSKRSVEELYRGTGFLGAEVDIQTTAKAKPGWVGLPLRFGLPVTVHVGVNEGQQTRLESLTINGGTGLEAALLVERRPDFVLQPLDKAGLEQLAEEITDLYMDQGYMNALTMVATEVNAGRDKADAVITVIPDNEIRLRSIVIRGNQRTRRHVIARELALKVGVPITPRRIAETRRALYDLELFRLVRPELVGDDPGLRDLLLDVEERRNILLETGGGVSSDEGARITGRATHRNIGGLGHRLSMLGQVGYGWVGNEWRLDTAVPVWRAATRYELPYVPGRGQRLILEGLIHETVQEPTWRLSRSGGSVAVKMRLGPETEAVVDYRVQARRIEDVDPGSLVNGDPWIPLLGLEPDLTGDVITSSEPRVVSGGSLLFYRDGRDDRFDPRRGGTTSAMFEVSDGAFVKPVTLRSTGRFERLIPMGPVVLDLVAFGGIGWAQGTGVTLPLEDRFYLGGGSTLRGFRLNSVGPANLTSRPEIPFPGQIEPAVDGISLRNQPAHWVATGGDAFAAFSAEIWLPLPLLGFSRLDSTSLVFFTDTGHVGFLDPSVITSSRVLGTDPPIRTSFGTGLRIATPIGPASFDVGFNPNPLSEREEPWILPHLSIGVL